MAANAKGQSFFSRAITASNSAILARSGVRNTSINTTMKYYVNLEADEVAAELWRGFQEREGAISSYGSGGHGSRTHNGLRRT